MMLDPLRVKNHLEPVRIFRSNFSTAVPFFRLWLIEASRSIIKFPISFFEFSKSSDSESDEIIFAWVWLKTTVKTFRKDFYGVYSGDIRSFIQVLELFSFFFFFLPHRGEMTRPFFVREYGNLSRTSSHCHPLCIWTIIKMDCPRMDRPGMDVPKYIFRPVPFNHLMISSLDYGFFIFNRSLKIKLDLEHIRIITLVI